MGAILKIEVLADAKNAKKALDETGTAAERMDAKLSTASKVAAGALAGLGAAGWKAVKGAEAAATANARLGQTLDNMGMGRATERVLANTDAMSLKTGVDHKAIKEGQALLATFSDVAASADQQGGAFDRATQASVDLASAGYGTIESNAVGLGKALQDPIKGMAALTKAGTLTKAEMEQIAAEFERTGDKAAAQNSILEAVEKQVGGVAEATANGSDLMANAWTRVTEAIGAGLMPVMDELVPIMTGMAGWLEDNADWVVKLGLAAAGAATGVLALHGAIKTYIAITRTVAAVTQAAATAKTVMRLAAVGLSGPVKAATVAMRAFTLALLTNPVVLIVTALLSLVAVFVTLYKRNEKFRNAVDAAWEWMKQAASAVTEWIKQAWNKLWDFLKRAVELYLAPYRWVYEQLKKITGAAVEWIKGKWQTFTDWIKRVWDSVSGAFSRGWDAIKSTGGRALDWMRGKVQGLFDKLKAVTSPIDAMRRGFETAKRVIGGAIDWLIGKVQALIDKIRNVKLPTPSFSFGGFGASSFTAAASPAFGAASTSGGSRPRQYACDCERARRDRPGGDSERAAPSP